MRRVGAHGGHEADGEACQKVECNRAHAFSRIKRAPFALLPDVLQIMTSMPLYGDAAYV
jgi:hypothetical protein